MNTEDAIREVINISCDNGNSSAEISAALLWPAVEFISKNEGKAKAKLSLVLLINAIDCGAFDAVAALDALN